MKRFKVYTSKGVYVVEDVTCPLNAIGIIKRNLGNAIKTYDVKEIDDYEYDDNENDCIGVL